jgi:DNA-binding XRE family transcriptional regulator
MDSTQFSQARHLLGKTQSQLARLLSVSPKAVQSFEQGWRRVPAHVERQVLLLASLKRSAVDGNVRPCWELKNCPDEWKDHCIVWELKARHFCWFLSGTFCQGRTNKSWDEKMQFCRECEVYRAVLPDL